MHSQLDLGMNANSSLSVSNINLSINQFFPKGRLVGFLTLLGSIHKGNAYGEYFNHYFCKLV